VIHGTGVDFRFKCTVYDFRQSYHLNPKEALFMADVNAPMPGKICEVKVSPGDSVIEDQEVLVLEAMKMEMPIVATAAGTVKSVNCATGDAVQGGDILVVIE
jgi:biotin carboxyl carrier protein